VTIDFNELAETDPEAAIKLAMKVFGMTRQEAEDHVSIQVGIIPYDIVELDKDGNEVPSGYDMSE